MAQNTTPRISGLGWVVAAVFALFAIVRCSPSTTQGPPAPPATSGAVSGTTKYVSAKQLNCRSASAANASVVKQFARGDAIVSVETRDGWERVESTPECWVSAKFLAGTALASNPSEPAKSSLYGSSVSESVPSQLAPLAAASAVRSASYSSNRIKASSKKKHRRSSGSKRRSTGSYIGGSCPCSGGNVCIGPRGGRYCITSGGNKRYGV